MCVYVEISVTDCNHSPSKPIYGTSFFYAPMIGLATDEEGTKGQLHKEKIPPHDKHKATKQQESTEPAQTGRILKVFP